MAIEVKFRRGTTAEHTSFTGANGEITIDTTVKTLRVHDGVTAGGVRLAKYSEIAGQTANLQSVSTSIIPSANVTYDLGSPERQWRSLYVSGNTIFIGDKTISTDQGQISFTDQATGEPISVQAKEIVIGTANNQTTLKTSDDGKLTTVSAAGAELPTEFANVSITNLVLQSVLGTQYGGTGLTSFTQNGVMFASNTSSLGFLTGTSGQLLQVGADGTPTFDKLDGGEF